MARRPRCLTRAAGESRGHLALPGAPAGATRADTLRSVASIRWTERRSPPARASGLRGRPPAAGSGARRRSAPRGLIGHLLDGLGQLVEVSSPQADEALGVPEDPPVPAHR